MLKSLKWYYKLLIIFGIMLLFYVFSNHGFILNVNAKSKWSREVLFYNEDGIQVFPTLNKSSNDKIYSNYLSGEDLTKTTSTSTGNVPMSLMSFYKKIELSNGEVISSTQSTNTIWTANKTLNSPNPSGNTYGNFIHKFYISPWRDRSLLKVNKYHTYTLLFEISRDTYSFYHNGSEYTIEDFEFGGQLYNESGNSQLNLLNYVNLVDIDFITPQLGDDDTPYSFLRIVFESNDNFPNYDLYLGNFYVGLINDNSSIGDNVNISGGYKFFIANTSNTDSVYNFSRIFLIEDLNVVIGDIDYSGASGSSMSSTIYEQCDTLDLGCHVRNLSRGVESITKNLIHSVRQLLSYLFVPNPEDVALMFTDFRTALLEKLGFLGYFIDLIEDFLGEISTIVIDNDPAITLPQLKEPFSNTVIWNGGTYYIKYYMTYGALGTLYNIYYLFISAYLVFLFINFCIDSLDDIFVGRVGGNLTGEMLNEINDSDYTPQHAYTPRHSQEHTSLYRHLRDRR